MKPNQPKWLSFQAQDSRFIWFLVEWVFISMEGFGTGSGEEPGIVLLFMGNLGQLFQHLQHMSRQFLLIMLSLCRQPIIGYTTVNSIVTGESGTIGTGTGKIGIMAIIIRDGNIIIELVLTVMTTIKVGVMTKGT